MKPRAASVSKKLSFILSDDTGKLDATLHCWSPIMTLFKMIDVLSGNMNIMMYPSYVLSGNMNITMYPSYARNMSV